MYYTYRVYNGSTGHEYADVDTLETARIVAGALSLVHRTPMTDYVIDVLVSEPTA